MTLRCIMLLWIAVMVAGCGPCGCGGARKPALRLATWNVENLFDVDDDPDNQGDDEYTPESWRRWTADLYTLKLAHLADVLHALDADIVGLQEIENRRVLDDLVAVLRVRHGVDYPHIVHREGPDHRGVDVALLAKVAPREVQWLTPVPEQREVLVVDFVVRGAPLTVMVNHWKSRWGSEEKARLKRHRQAGAVREAVEARLAADPDAALVVMGDFNDNVADASLQDVLGSGTNRAAFLSGDGGTLYNLHGDLPASKQGTFYYRSGKVWNSFDSMSVSRALLDRAEGGECGSRQWRVRPGTYGPVVVPGMTGGDARPIPFRYARDPETRRWGYETGYSDHLPVRGELELR